ncbi:hypothetical protein [Streptomyces sp. NPDC013455]|uniref:hypothetical protein n=1 Tax=Streptomyces sp. NPDC013455 TaxID=3155605 RepID=UPI0033DAE6EA
MTLANPVPTTAPHSLLVFLLRFAFLLLPALKDDDSGPAGARHGSGRSGPPNSEVTP